MTISIKINKESNNMFVFAGWKQHKISTSFLTDVKEVYLQYSKTKAVKFLYESCSLGYRLSRRVVTEYCTPTEREQLHYDLMKR